MYNKVYTSQLLLFNHILTIKKLSLTTNSKGVSRKGIIIKRLPRKRLIYFVRR